MAIIEGNKDPWGSFQKLGAFTHLYKPLDSSGPNPAEPGLIIICTWAFAQPRHISKYLRNYLERYPASQILVLQADTWNMLWRPDNWQFALFAPAIAAIKNYVSSADIPNQRVLLHLFSNGGCYVAVQLAAAYRQSFAKGSEERHDLPVNAIVFDSCPTPPRFQIGITAMSMGLPKTLLARVFGISALYLVLSTMVILHVTGISELFLAKAYRVLNEPGGPFLNWNIPRTYIYSKIDQVIPEQDILMHAQEAKAVYKGLSQVHVEEFVGSQHVNHMSTDPERYWRIVRETWEEAVNVELN